LFGRKRAELGLLDGPADALLEGLGETFDFAGLEACVGRFLRTSAQAHTQRARTARGVLALARSNYEVEFDPASRLSERVIFPQTPAESRGIEDARWVEFHESDGSSIYRATYTAYDGQIILPQLLQTRDFLNFRISTLNGPEVQNKGMALFPRRINGGYAMISRQNGENMYVMFSDELTFWREKRLLLRPTFPWEIVQVGNCGSPLETDAGWLVLTHGVGPMRRYTIGAILLDRDDPTRVIGRLRQPLLTPTAREREGFVPNVVYSCGSLIHAGRLILAYAMSDECAGFATVPLDELLRTLRAAPLSPP
jgi:predicted GH43/DUF377 family glycosyl hydrolase